MRDTRNGVDSGALCDNEPACNRLSKLTANGRVFEFKGLEIGCIESLFEIIPTVLIATAGRVEGQAGPVAGFNRESEPATCFHAVMQMPEKRFHVTEIDEHIGRKHGVPLAIRLCDELSDISLVQISINPLPTCFQQHLR